MSLAGSFGAIALTPGPRSRNARVFRAVRADSTTPEPRCDARDSTRKVPCLGSRTRTDHKSRPRARTHTGAAHDDGRRAKPPAPVHHQHDDPARRASATSTDASPTESANAVPAIRVGTAERR